MFMFGQIETSDIEDSQSAAFTKIFLVVFMITMMILFFNLLIALMGDTFERTKEKIENHYWKEMASFLVDQAAPVSFETLLEACGLVSPPVEDEFIHVVKYTSDVKRSGKVFGPPSAMDAAQDDFDDIVNSGVAEKPTKKSLLEISLEVVRGNILKQGDLFQKIRDSREIIARDAHITKGADTTGSQMNNEKK
jgi:hypothetical protein